MFWSGLVQSFEAGVSMTWVRKRGSLLDYFLNARQTPVMRLAPRHLPTFSVRRFFHRVAQVWAGVRCRVETHSQKNNNLGPFSNSGHFSNCGHGSNPGKQHSINEPIIGMLSPVPECRTDHWIVAVITRRHTPTLGDRALLVMLQSLYLFSFISIVMTRRVAMFVVVVTFVVVSVVVSRSTPDTVSVFVFIVWPFLNQWVCCNIWNLVCLDVFVSLVCRLLFIEFMCVCIFIVLVSFTQVPCDVPILFDCLFVYVLCVKLCFPSTNASVLAVRFAFVVRLAFVVLFATNSFFV